MKKVNFSAFLSGLALGVFFQCTTPALAADKLTMLFQNKEVSYTLETLKSKLKIHSITIHDPNYGKQKSFDGFEMLDVFRLTGVDIHSIQGEVLFSCKDGYTPSVSFETLLKFPAYLAFRETGKTNPPFEKIIQGKTSNSPAPFYLIWKESKELPPFVPWPDQLIRMEVIQFSKKFPNVFPHAASPDSSEYRGFLIFKADCFRCHTINLEGGDIGPELNSPKNITEYWKEKTIREFVKNSLAFRYRSRMPPFPQLSEKDMDDLINYLEFMKDFKIQQ